MNNLGSWLNVGNFLFNTVILKDDHVLYKHRPQILAMSDQFEKTGGLSSVKVAGYFDEAKLL